MKRILVTSDWHGDWVTAGYRRSRDVELAAENTARVAIEQKVDAYMFLGDLSNPDSGVGTLAALGTALGVAAKLSAWNVPSFWIAGNHDVIEDGAGRTVLTPLARAAISKCYVFEHPPAGLVPAVGFNLLLLPYVARASSYDPDRYVRDVVKAAVIESSAVLEQTCIVAGHLQVEGATIGSETRDMPRGRDVAFPTEAVKLLPRRLCLNGHYHRRQRVGEIEIPGSLERLTFGEEANRPGFLIVEV